MSTRAVVTAHFPTGARMSFVIVDDPDAIPWGEQVNRIAEVIPDAIRATVRWEVYPITTDVSQRAAFRSVP